MASTETPKFTAGTDSVDIASYFLVSSVTLLVYDYFLLLDLECKFVWSDLYKWSNGLYLLQRYFPLMDMTLFLAGTFSSGIDANYCQNILKSSLWLHTVGICLSEIVLSMRVWAVSRHRFRKYFSYILSACLVTVLVGTTAVTGIFSTARYDSLPLPGLIRGCLHIGNPIMYAALFGILVVYEGACFALIIPPAISQFKNRKLSRLYNPVYRDAIFQYVLFVAIAGITIALVCGVSVNLSYVCTPLFCASHSIATSRIVLHIRQATDDTVSYSLSQSAISSSIVFAANAMEIEA